MFYRSKFDFKFINIYKYVITKFVYSKNKIRKIEKSRLSMECSEINKKYKSSYKINGGKGSVSTEFLGVENQTFDESETKKRL